ncbi:YrzI family small protein [Heyndrickxia ginsengihumi]|uniref:YrzI family small protein n=1 Tax=Heyndrickxia ginsengihumi TaxID=363870 RepID=A0A6M0P627_9BACI|nr:YrzI family small protein [Heyndrickxia ginsengihumi]MBE6183712.1 YrzI family small protein [Bacillus sp. (in: firmicutes)]MCM3021811.1 YrzI family small protein [Heyndrickxia ginsengihumi]NEY19745.1 YrzI family small protein [Heyndrickxia ginsengihumi]
MTLNLIFITVTIRRNAKTLEQQLHDEQVKERFEELNIKKAELHITHL